jgi:anthraniloyl-CoA monooxygenase
MKIHVVGAGPAGLYSAILIKKLLPDASITVFERNKSDDTFGFGIVLSAETLANLKESDGPTHAAIASNFAYWDDIDVQFKGHVMRSGGHGFSGIRRLTLLNILQDRATELGVEVKFQTDFDYERDTNGADLVIASDGINSVARQRLQSHFLPHVDLRSNRFVWLGAKMNLPAFYYSFRENEAGIWNMHAYQYTPGESTIVIETTDEAFIKSGLSIDDEAATAAYIQGLFEKDLNGARVLTNRSTWRQFPTYHCERWHHAAPKSNGAVAHTVLLGDAAHTAHFSIGSGTKLALEDAIALAAAIKGEPTNLANAMATYEAGRRDEVGRIQHSANVSLVWFENVKRFWHMHPIQFNVSLLTRSKQITFDNLAIRDAQLVGDATRWWNKTEASKLKIEFSESDAFLNSPPMFAPFRLRNMTLENRVVVSPMAQYSAAGGMPDDWHVVHYGSRALGGAGLIFTEMTCPSAQARITEGCTGLWNKKQADAWKRVVDFVHQRSGAKICMQLGHAGRKGSTQLGWESMDAPLKRKNSNWPLLSASPIAYKPGVNQVPSEMTTRQMALITKQFVASALLAHGAGFDMLELHMAHGYLLASFLSPITNKRTDDYGGTLANRLRFPMALFSAVRKVWPAEKPMSVRLSATDWIEGGMTAADAVEIAKAFKSIGCDLIDVSTGQTSPQSRPVYGRMYQAAFSEQIRLEADIATMAVGAVTTADQVNTLLISGRADLIALARVHLANPYFTLHASAEYQQKGVSWPLQYQTGAAQLFGLKKK